MPEPPTPPARMYLWQFPVGIVLVGLAIATFSRPPGHPVVDRLDTPFFIVGVLLIGAGWVNRIRYRNALGHHTIPRYITKSIGLGMLSALLVGLAALSFSWMGDFVIGAILATFATIAAAGAALTFRNGRRRYRAAHVLCLHCGHQLLSYAETCAECGTPVNAMQRQRLRSQHDDVTQPGHPESADELNNAR